MKNLLLVMICATFIIKVHAQSVCPNVFKCGDSLTDTRDGIKYPTVQIGTQCWLAADLRATIYLNGDTITNITNPVTWCNLTTAAWCDYDDLPANGITYGHLYNWYAVIDNRSLCPKGWYIPSFNEFNILVNFLGGTGPAAAAMASTFGWVNGNGTNSSGFNALPTGYRNPTTSCSYEWMGYSTNFLSTDYVNLSNIYGLFINSGTVLGFNLTLNQIVGLPVRCVKEY